MEVDVLCPLCRSQPESLKHILCDCSYVSPLWSSQVHVPLPSAGMEFGTWLSGILCLVDNEIKLWTVALVVEYLEE